MICDATTLNRVRNYGALKYNIQAITVLLNLDQEQKDIFLKEFEDQESNIFKYYNQGIEIGQYNIDAELAKQAEKGDVDSINKLEERQQNRKVDNLLSEMYGL